MKSHLRTTWYFGTCSVHNHCKMLSYLLDFWSCYFSHKNQSCLSNFYKHFSSVEDLIPFTSMKKLNLSFNKINSLFRSSDENFEIKNLQNVDLSHNLIQVLHPFIFTSFPALEHLNLSDNIIHTISSTCFFLPSLSSLNLSNNKISDISSMMMQSLTRLKHLLFSHNSISTLAGNEKIYILKP